MDSCGVFDGVEGRLHKVLVDALGIVVFGPSLPERSHSDESSSYGLDFTSHSYQLLRSNSRNSLSVLTPGIKSEMMSARSCIGTVDEDSVIVYGKLWKGAA